MSVESQHHLDIEDLLLAADGELRDEGARAHLASCVVCRSDTDCWRTVGLGVRHVAAQAVPPPTPVAEGASATSSGSRSPAVLPAAFWHADERLRRRVLVGAVAAALLAVGAGVYGATVSQGGNGAPPGSPPATAVRAGLTAVNGCPSLAAVTGTLEQLSGSELVIAASDGQSVAITTGASTRMIGSESNGTLEDISNGAQVAVSGTASDGTIAAATVTVGAIDTVKPFEPPQPSGAPVKVGTVSGAHTGGFTVVSSGGTRTSVTTTASTAVIVLRTLAVQQLQLGRFTVAVGNTSGEGGTLVAGAIEQVPQPISFPQGPGPSKGSQAGCSPQNVMTSALLAAS